MADATRTDTPRRIQRKRTKGWKMPDNTVSVTRPGEFGNPFSVSKVSNLTLGEAEWWVTAPGESILWRYRTKGEAIAASVKAFEGWLALPQQRRLRDRAAFALRGKHLACWCPVGSPCHGDVLLRLANAPAAQEGEKPNG
ncbi:DUF4326 domain-containing protein [Azospirillum sp. TSA2s]|uniref:DUF4326 domain-containing protein n=1 Tax=Azospirillum sp. TSA2s TaxID=709810 RepID=UPI0010AA6133|nr:DUF4326 domain-containing protein [Azospirillum sp. TSA2s]QCG95027.1 DUF4326 domain-containing protein [Azospirillum sp. TSA2s]